MQDIYLLFNKKSRKMYIGKSFNPYYRFKKHMSNLRCNHHINKALQADFDKYGENSFTYCVLERCTNTSEPHRERYWMIALRTYIDKYGYNGNDPYFLSRGNKNKTFYSAEDNKKLFEDLKFHLRRHKYIEILEKEMTK